MEFMIYENIVSRITIFAQIFSLNEEFYQAIKIIEEKNRSLNNDKSIDTYIRTEWITVLSSYN